MVGLVWVGLLPVLAVVAFGVLLVRAALCLSSFCSSTSTRTIGLLELGLGAFTVLMVAAGYGLAL